MPRLSDTRYSANRRARQIEIWGVSQKSFPTKIRNVSYVLEEISVAPTIKRSIIIVTLT